jgi:hypothetical protein
MYAAITRDYDPLKRVPRWWRADADFGALTEEPVAGRGRREGSGSEVKCRPFAEES